MSIIKKAPAIMTREVRLEEPVNELRRRLCAVHREQRRPRHQRRPEESPLAGSGLPQVAGPTPATALTGPQGHHEGRAKA